MSTWTTPRRSASVALAICVLISGFVGSLALATVPAGATASTASTASTARSAGDFVGLINGLRSSRGLAPLAVDGALAASAQNWTNTMASTNTLAHDPSLGSAVSGWTMIGENVGNGGSVSALWSSFVASPTHLTNILNPGYTHVGVGYLQDGRGLIWTAHRFMTRAGSTPPPPAPPPTAPPAPAPPAPAPVVTTPPPPPTTTVTPTTAAPSQNVATASAAPAAGSRRSDGDQPPRAVHDPSADPERVAEVLDALRALPA